MEIGTETRKTEARRVLQELNDSVRMQNWQQTMRLAEELHDHSTKIVAMDAMKPVLELVNILQRNIQNCKP